MPPLAGMIGRDSSAGLGNGGDVSVPIPRRRRVCSVFDDPPKDSIRHNQRLQSSVVAMASSTCRPLLPFSRPLLCRP